MGKAGNQGWYVELTGPAEGVVQHHKAGRITGSTRAEVAQAYLYLFRRDEFDADIRLLRRGSGRQRRLAAALHAEDLMRRQELPEALEGFVTLSKEPGVT